VVMAEDKYTPVEVVIDANTQSRRIKVDTSLELPDETQGIELLYGTQALFQATIYKGATDKPYSFAVGTEFIFGMDSVITPTTPNPVLSLNTQFNVSGDWQFDPAKGLICWRANLATVELKTLLLKTTNATLKMTGYLWQLPPTYSPTPIAAWDINVKKVAVDPLTAVAVTNINASLAAYYVPVWGDGAYERRKDGRTQYLFPDGKWRAKIPILIDGKETETWGNPED